VGGVAASLLESQRGEGCSVAGKNLSAATCHWQEYTFRDTTKKPHHGESNEGLGLRRGILVVQLH